MASEADQSQVVRMLVRRSWQASLLLGLATLAIGIVVALHPSGSLNVVAVLLGVLLLISGLLQLVQALSTKEGHRAWSAIAGLAFIILGVVLIRHLHLTRVLIALLIGIVWIIQGVVEIMAAASDRERPDRGWLMFLGIVSLAAGIVVVAAPVGSLEVLAVLLGVWFIVLGALEVIGAFVVRRAVRRAA